MNIKEYNEFYNIIGEKHSYPKPEYSIYQGILELFRRIDKENEAIMNEVIECVNSNPDKAFREFCHVGIYYKLFDYIGCDYKLENNNLGNYAEVFDQIKEKNNYIYNEVETELKNGTANNIHNSESVPVFKKVEPQPLFTKANKQSSKKELIKNDNLLSNPIKNVPPQQGNGTDYIQNNNPCNNTINDQGQQATVITPIYATSNDQSFQTPTEQPLPTQSKPVIVPNNNEVINQNQPMNVGGLNQFNNNPQLRTSGVNSQKHKHQYIPMVFDNNEACVTYVAKLNVDSVQRLSMKEYSQLSQQFLNTAKSDTIDIGRIYVVKAMDYGEKIKLEIYFINANEKRQHKEMFVDKEACEQGKVYSEFVNNGVHCFNTDMTHKKISEYMYKLILSKMDDREYQLPEASGFNIIDNKLYFVTKEYCEENGFPIVTDKTFKVDVEDGFTSEMAEKSFIELMNNHSDKMKFLLLNMLRVAGLLSYIMSRDSINFNKIVFINGDSKLLTKYLQIYDRGSRIIRPYSINVKADEIEHILEDESDCVVMFEDKATDSEFTKKNGVEAVKYICEELYDIQNDDEYDGMNIIAVFTERLNQIIESDQALNLDYSSFRNNSDYSDLSILEILYILDDLIVKRVCSNEMDFIKNAWNMYGEYEEKSKAYGIKPDAYSCLMIAYHEIVRQYHKVEAIISEESMAQYLAEIMKRSDDTYNGGSIVEEFKVKLNQLIVKEEIELVENSEMNNCFGSSGKRPIVFCDDDWLYFPKETFEFIVHDITLASNGNMIRRSLDEEGLLKTSDALTYKVTLYDMRYSGRTSVTAVKLSVLSGEALLRKRGGMFNYEPCADDGSVERIPLGTDEKGRTIYWSIGHGDIGNTNVLVNGNTGMGKTTAVNMIVKQLFNKGKHIVYVDFSNSNSIEQLEKTGFDKSFQDKFFYRTQISKCLDDEGKLKEAIERLKSDNLILVFESEKYGEDTELFLSVLYDMIKVDPALSIFIVIDEVHNLEYKKGSAIYTIVEEGRKNGVSLISIFHGPHETKPKQYSMINQADLKLIFKLNDFDDAQGVTGSNMLKPPGLFSERLMNLKKRSCLVIGNLENSDGELMNKRFVGVKIADING